MKSFDEWMKEQSNPEPKKEAPKPQRYFPLGKVLKKEGWRFAYCDNTSRVFDIAAILESGSSRLEEKCEPVVAPDGEIAVKFNQYILREACLGQAHCTGYKKVQTTI